MKNHHVSQHINTGFPSISPFVGHKSKVVDPVNNAEATFPQLVNFFIRTYTLHLVKKSPQKYQSLPKSVREKIARLAEKADELAEILSGDLRYYASLNRKIRSSIHAQFQDEKIWAAVIKNWNLYNHILEDYSTNYEREQYVFSRECNLLNALSDYLPTIKIKYPLAAKHLNRKIVFRHWLILVIIGNIMQEVMREKETVDLLFELESSNLYSREWF